MNHEKTSPVIVCISFPLNCCDTVALSLIPSLTEGWHHILLC